MRLLKLYDANYFGGRIFPFFVACQPMEFFFWLFLSLFFDFPIRTLFPLQMASPCNVPIGCVTGTFVFTGGLAAKEDESIQDALSKLDSLEDRVGAIEDHEAGLSGGVSAGRKRFLEAQGQLKTLAETIADTINSDFDLEMRFDNIAHRPPGPRGDVGAQVKIIILNFFF